MTTEEKAKAYDEAIMIAKSCLEKGVNPANNPLDYFIGCVCKMFPGSFPEFRESEDERIRKFIQNELVCLRATEIKGSERYNEITSAITYLEKQKEQKPTAEEVLIKAGLKPYKDGNQWCILVGDNIQEGICGFSDTIEGALYQFLLEILEELKPVECIEDSVKYEEGFKAGRESGLRDGQKYVLNNLDSYGLCKPAEWSEEDEKIAKEIEEELWYPGDFPDCPSKEESELYDDCQKRLGWFKNRLKSLRPSWKPSEQEKGALRTAIHTLTDERNFPKAAAHLQNILDAFEGEEPRKEWKPSEEQMVALKEACDKHWEPDGLEPLYTLYQDLKKL